MSFPHGTGNRILRINPNTGEVWVLVERNGYLYEWRKVSDTPPPER